MLDLTTRSLDKNEDSGFAASFAADASVAQLAVVVAPIPLKTLRAGQHAEIASLIGRAQDVARLAEMGLRRGTPVLVIRNGITCILQLEGNRLCIRLSSELVILVNPT